MKTTRQQALAKGAAYGPREFGGITIYPVTLATLAILEESGNVLFSKGGKITMRALNEIAFVHSKDPREAACYVVDEFHPRRVAEFAATIPMEHAGAINEWLGEQIQAFILSQSKPKK